MNLLLLAAEAIDAEGIAVVSGRQANHAIEVGSIVKVGIINGKKGTGIIQKVILSRKHADCRILLKVSLTDDSEPKNAPLIDLLIALPRPKTFEKVLQYAASMGVGRIFVCCTSRVEKSYFSSPLMSEENIRYNLQLGLEQCVDTLCPDVIVYASWHRCLERMKERIADEPNTKLIVAHPDRMNNPALAVSECGLQDHEGPVLVAVGPEGGFLDSEVEELEVLGFKAAHLGSRILRVEAALIMVLSQMQMLLMDQNLRGGKKVPERNVECVRPIVGKSLVELPRRERDTKKIATEAAQQVEA